MGLNEPCTVGWCETGGPCYCYLTSRTTVVVISVISLLAAMADCMFLDRSDCCGVLGQVETMRSLLRMLFQVANLLLMIGAVIDQPQLIQIYVWYTLGFIVLGFAVSILDLLGRLSHEGKWCVINFLTEVAFLFVLYRCLALVDLYRRELEPEKAPPIGPPAPSQEL